MTKNKIRVLCIVMVLTMAVLGVVAFADGTQQSREIRAENSQPVQIEQIEQERKDPAKLEIDADDLQAFSQYDPLKPAEYADGYGWTESNTSGMWLDITGARDKIVTVANRGDGDVYFRTIIAYEVHPQAKNLIKINLNTDDYDWSQGAAGNDITVLENVELNYTYNSGEEGAADYIIKGNFNVVAGVYNRQVLPAEGTSGGVTFDPVLARGATSAPSLLQVAMDKNATEQQIQQLGATYDIFVWSQAVAVEEGTDAVTALNDKFGVVAAGNLGMPTYRYKAADSNTSAGTATDDNISQLNDAGGKAAPQINDTSN